jgi:hypothetical protein
MPRPTLILSLCAVAFLLLPACQNVPKYKKSNGRFDEWQSVEGKHFAPSTGTVAAVDLQANTVTITKSADTRVVTVTPHTRIIHEATDIPLAQLPLNQDIRYTMSTDGQQLLTIWYGHLLYAPQRPAAQKKQAVSLP